MVQKMLIDGGIHQGVNMTKDEANKIVQQKLAQVQELLAEVGNLADEHSLDVYLGSTRYITKDHWAASDFGGEWVSSSEYNQC